MLTVSHEFKQVRIRVEVKHELSVKDESLGLTHQCSLMMPRSFVEIISGPQVNYSGEALLR